MEKEFEDKINESNSTIETAIKYAILGNIIDFNPIHTTKMEDVMDYFKEIAQRELIINDVARLIDELKGSKTLLYLGDNCGEICLDKILIKQIKVLNLQLDIYFGTRGAAVVNDSIEEDAYAVGINQYAKVLSNGDYSLGTVLERTSNEFKKIYEKADLVIANDIGVAQKSMICMRKKAILE